ncbi:MAG: hypothetical protein HC923_01065, partial [Myxococcales bacterium]|nr:hypothetical protein [Myxococcales bacterium]
MVGGVHAGVARLVVRPLGPELPSLVGPLVALGVALIFVKKRWLQPRDTWRVGVAPEVSAGESPSSSRPGIA